jgi:osmotically-inducible protein OsmY
MLCGVVDIASQRDAAERIALRVPRRVRVRNRLKVWIAVSAEDVAERITDAIVSADGITVTVGDDVVTLTGSVRPVTTETPRSLLPRGRRASSASGTRSASRPDWTLA